MFIVALGCAELNKASRRDVHHLLEKWEEAAKLKLKLVEKRLCTIMVNNNVFDSFVLIVHHYHQPEELRIAAMRLQALGTPFLEPELQGSPSSGKNLMIHPACKIILPECYFPKDIFRSGSKSTTTLSGSCSAMRRWNSQRHVLCACSRRRS